MKPKYKFGDVLYFPTYEWGGAFKSIDHLTVCKITLERDKDREYFVYGDAICNEENESELFLTEAGAKARAYRRVLATARSIYNTVVDFKELVEGQDGKISVQSEDH